ncbi:hypothetical protein AOLI_G00211480 [Acnodon oligacanthus]
MAAELWTLSRELLQLSQQIRPLPELHEWKTRLEATWDASYTAVSRPSLVATSTRLPRAWVLGISKWFLMVLSKHGDVGTVVLRAGVNDIPSSQSEAFKEHLRLLLDTVKKRTKTRVFISGPLPTYRRGSEVFSRLYALGVGYTQPAFWKKKFPSPLELLGLHFGAQRKTALLLLFIFDEVIKKCHSSSVLWAAWRKTKIIKGGVQLVRAAPVEIPKHLMTTGCALSSHILSNSSWKSQKTNPST